MVLIFKIFLIAFCINLLYELAHSWLYETCQKASWKKYAYLMFKGALFDGAMITLVYYLANGNIVIFVLLALVFAYAWEFVAVKNKRWEYSVQMPLVLGVGITPLIQLALTGIIAIYISFAF